MICILILPEVRPLRNCARDDCGAGCGKRGLEEEEGISGGREANGEEIVQPKDGTSLAKCKRVTTSPEGQRSLGKIEMREFGNNG